MTGDTVQIEVDAGFRKRKEVVKLNKEEDKVTESGERGKVRNYMYYYNTTIH